MKISARIAVAADVLRGVVVGVLLAYAVYAIVLRDAGAVIVRYAGY